MIGAVALAQSSASPACYKYDPAQVTLRGTLVFQLYSDPPAFGEAEQYGYFLQFPKRLCVRGDAATPGYTEEKDLREVQVSGTTRIFALLSGQVGKQVALAGTLRHSLDKSAPTRVYLRVSHVE
jgi:hypothetical protein